MGRGFSRKSPSPIKKEEGYAQDVDKKETVGDYFRDNDSDNDMDRKCPGGRLKPWRLRKGYDVFYPEKDDVIQDPALHWAIRAAMNATGQKLKLTKEDVGSSYVKYISYLSRALIRKTLWTGKYAMVCGESGRIAICEISKTD